MSNRITEKVIIDHISVELTFNHMNGELQLGQDGDYQYDTIIMTRDAVKELYTFLKEQVFSES